MEATPDKPTADDRMARLVFELRPGADWQVRISDLAAMRRLMGSRLMAAFLRCYVHSDRVDSLVSMFTASLAASGRDSVRAKRDFQAFVSFLMGTLRELGYALDNLVGALRARGIWNKDEWAKGLQRWQHYATSEIAVGARDKLAFHVDPTVVSAGLDSLAGRLEKVVVEEGDTKHAVDTWCRLAHVALLEGASFTLGDLDNLMAGPNEFLNISHEVHLAFLAALERCGLRPITVVNRTATRLPPLDEPMRSGS